MPTREECLNHLEDMRKLESDQAALFSDILDEVQDEALHELFQRLRDEEIAHEKSVRALQAVLRESY